MALYGVVPSLLATPWLAGDAMASAASMLADLDAEQATRARARFDRAARRGELGWADGGSTPHASLLQQALTSNLVVLGQADSSNALTRGLPPRPGALSHHRQRQAHAGAAVRRPRRCRTGSAAESSARPCSRWLPTRMQDCW
jgi:hypothetical protein